MKRDWKCSKCKAPITREYTKKPVLYPNWEYLFCQKCETGTTFVPVGDFQQSQEDI